MIINEVIANDNVYLNYHCPTNTKVKTLDVMKLRKLLNDMEFNPIASGTNYIIEELKYMIENNIKEIKTLKETYSISAKIHNTDIKNIQWDIESAITTMKKCANPDLMRSILYWYDNYKTITPRFFMITMLDYLNENFSEYKK